jgi:hypothetical protein
MNAKEWEGLMRKIQLMLLVTAVGACSCAAYATGTLQFGDWDVTADGSGWANVMWSSDETLIGLQFDVNEISITSVDGGITEDLGWVISHNDFRVLGYTFGAYIPTQPKPTHLLTLHFDVTGDEVTFDGVIFVDAAGNPMKVDASDSIVFAPACPSDINGDATVDVIDLLEVVGTWGESDVPADINGDGVVNVSDLLAVVDAWGPC